MSGHLFIISGASGSGKSALLQRISTDTDLGGTLVAKSSTRQPRDTLFDDIVHVPEIRDDEFTFVYPMNENIYGIKAADATAILAAGRDAFVIVSDLRVVAEIKRYFGSLAVSLYVFRNLSGAQLARILASRGTSRGATSGDRQTRLNRLYLMQRLYVENIAQFDHVILNTTTPGDMLRQVKHLVEAYRGGYIRRSSRGPVVFLVAGASGTGKRTLMDAMFTLGRRSINVIPKATTRALHPDDGPEIYHLAEPDLEKLDIEYDFHHTKYGIDTKIMWQSLAEGRPQILITNIQQFARFRESFGDLVVSVYLHATRTRKELYESQLVRHRDIETARDKVKEISKIHQDYIDNIASFHHVLLNTIQREDFWEQMFRLIQAYRS